MSVSVEAIRQLESYTPLADTDELREAQRKAPDRAAQVLEQAWLLGRRLGFPEQITQMRYCTSWIVSGLALGLALTSFSTARSLLGGGHQINAVAAFASLLGWHFFMMLLWLCGLLCGYRGGTLLGRLALAITSRLPFQQRSHALALFHAFSTVLKRAGLWPWLTGTLSHAIWALCFVVLLIALGFGFAFHAYILTWETTILTSEFFQRFVSITGVLPSLLGFSIPTVAAIEEAGTHAATVLSGQREWAWWLLGCVTVYGLLPRLLCMVWSAWRWRVGCARLVAIDLADPYTQGIVRRLDALERSSEIIDPERVFEEVQKSALRHNLRSLSEASAVIGFELPPERPWPPKGIATDENMSWKVSGSASERQQVTDYLARRKPHTLLVICVASSSPDRGTARFLRNVAALARRTALWLQTASAAQADDVATNRWECWLKTEGLDQIQLLRSSGDAAIWLENAYG